MADVLESRLRQVALDAIAFYDFLGMHLIAVFNLCVCFPTNIDVVLPIKGCFTVFKKF